MRTDVRNIGSAERSDDNDNETRGMDLLCLDRELSGSLALDNYSTQMCACLVTGMRGKRSLSDRRGTRHEGAWTTAKRRYNLGANSPNGRNGARDKPMFGLISQAARTEDCADAVPLTDSCKRCPPLSGTDMLRAHYGRRYLLTPVGVSDIVPEKRIVDLSKLCADHGHGGHNARSGVGQPEAWGLGQGSIWTWPCVDMCVHVWRISITLRLTRLA